MDEVNVSQTVQEGSKKSPRQHRHTPTGRDAPSEEGVLDAFTLTCTHTTWVFRPCTPRGQRWLEENLYYGEELVVPKHNGPCVFRALRADGFVVLPCSGQG